MNPYQLGHASIIVATDKENTFDIYSRLLAERIIFLKTEITDEVANHIVAQMLFLDAEHPNKDITLFINTNGGSVTAAMTIYDAMTQLRSDVCTVCNGSAASMGVFLLSSGTKGKRYALPNSRIMLHQPSGDVQGKASDIEVAAKELLYLRESVNQILAANTNQTKEKIKSDSERDFFMNAESAKKYELIDRIIQKNNQ